MLISWLSPERGKVSRCWKAPPDAAPLLCMLAVLCAALLFAAWAQAGQARADAVRITAGRLGVQAMRAEARPRIVEDGFLFSFQLRTDGHAGKELLATLYDESTMFRSPYLIGMRNFRPRADQAWNPIAIFVPQSQVPWGVRDLGFYVVSAGNEDEWLFRISGRAPWPGWPQYDQLRETRSREYVWLLRNVGYDSMNEAYLMETELFYQTNVRRTARIVTVIHDEEFREVARVPGPRVETIINQRELRPPALRIPLADVERLGRPAQRFYLTPSVEEGTRLFVGNVHFEALAGNSLRAYQEQLRRDLKGRLERQIELLE